VTQTYNSARRLRWLNKVIALRLRSAVGTDGDFGFLNNWSRTIGKPTRYVANGYMTYRFNKAVKALPAVRDRFMAGLDAAYKRDGGFSSADAVWRAIDGK